MHHLIACTKSKNCPNQLQRYIPWVLCHIWKARNALIFEKTRVDPAFILRKAEEESKIWFELNFSEAVQPVPNNFISPITPTWKAPADDMLKCNIAASWLESSSRSGASWIVRDSRGKVIMHGRRSYSFVQSREMPELWAFHWAIESMSSMRMDKVIFESSCDQARTCFLKASSGLGSLDIVGNMYAMLQNLQNWSLDHVMPARNEVAQRIANSVTAEGRYQSYIAAGGPTWLKDLIASEAESAPSRP